MDKWEEGEKEAAKREEEAEGEEEASGEEGEEEWKEDEERYGNSKMGGNGGRRRGAKLIISRIRKLFTDGPTDELTD